MGYNTVDQTTPYRLRGLLQQTDEGLLWTPPSVRINQAGGDPPASVTRQFMEGFAVSYAGLQNRSGATITVGVGGRLPNRSWIAGQYTNGVYVDDTTDAQSATASDFPLETVNAGDGFIVASPYPFNAISLKVGTASVGGAVRRFQYSNFAGTGWTTLTNLFVQDVVTAGAQYATATENLFVWGAPADWGAVTSLVSIPTGLYAVKIDCPVTPPTTPGVATSLAVCQVFLGTESLADNATWEYSPNQPELRFPKCDALVALFSTADPGNRFTAHVRLGC